jgi:hypothetical protein
MLTTQPRSRPPIRSGRMSLQHVPYAQHHARLSLVAEVPSPQSEASKRQSILQQEDNSPQIGNPLSLRTNSDTTLYGPIRRRSLLQHGVATRTSYVEPDARQSLPSQRQSSADLQNFYYNPSKPTSSPLSDLAALTPSSDFMVPGPRTETPTELDYGHIGAFKLGTLRITNGAASPAPSSHGRAASLGAEEDYIMAGEARKSLESGHRHGLSQRSNTLSVPAETIKAPWIVRSESPLRQSHEIRYEPLTIDTHLPLDPSFAMFDFEGTEKLFKSTESPTKAQELANEYMQDIALSPFSFDNSPPVSPGFQATSKHMAIEDDLFEPEPDTPTDLGIHMPRSFDSGYGGGEPSSAPTRGAKGPPELAPKPLAKADSGYSSNVSLRSFKKDHSPPAREAPPTPPKEPVSRVASSTYSVQSEATIRAKRSLPALPVEEIPEPPMRQPPPVPVKDQSSERSSRNIQPPLVPQKGAEQASAPPQSYIAAKPTQSKQQNMLLVAQVGGFVREESPANSESSTSSTNSSSRWRPKISKRESQQRTHTQNEEVFTVQAFRTPSEPFRIPPPSAEARRKLEERVEAFPVACFPNTVAGTVGLRHSSSKETLGTIFSVGSAEVRDELSFARLQGDLPPIPPMPTIIQEPVPQPKPEINRRYTYQAPAQFPLQAPRQGRQSFQPVSRERGPSPGQRANWGRQSLQPMPSDRPAPRQQPDFETQVTSFDSISSSLGRSPYDVAKPAPAPKSVNERAKSMTAQFEADAAARFALSRQRNVSAESNTSTVIRAKKSYDSIANGNPYASGNSTAANSRASSREFPPAAHSNPLRRSYSNLPSQSSHLAAPPTSAFGPGHISVQYKDYSPEPEDDRRRFSVFTEREKKSKSPPPVSMTTQGRMSLTNLGAHNIIPPSRTPPVPTQSQPSRSAPGPPSQQQRESDPWAEQKAAWAGRRQSAGEVLQTRKSVEMRRPSFEYGQQQDHDMRMRQNAQIRRPSSTQPSIQYTHPRQSQENLRARQSFEMRRPESARPSGEYQRPQQQSLKHYESFDNAQQAQGQWTWDAYSNIFGGPGQQPQQAPIRQQQQHHYPAPAQQQEYDYTYGAYPHNKEIAPYHQHQEQQQQEAEYYEPTPSSPTYYQDQEQNRYLPEQLHHSANSTQDMLILDKFAGGLGYGYEPGYAGMRNSGNLLGGGAGRKAVEVNGRWGGDLRDERAFLRGVGVEG